MGSYFLEGREAWAAAELGGAIIHGWVHRPFPTRIPNDGWFDHIFPHEERSELVPIGGCFSFTQELITLMHCQFYSHVVDATLTQ